MKDSCKEEKCIVLHLDMDHFFSAVEERENPSLKGYPVVVGADPKGGAGRGVVKTCNYEARAFGIHSGMAISKAWRLCPNAIYVPGNYRLYKKVSRDIMTILGKYSNQIHQWGLDEAFLDISSQVKDVKEAKILAINMKHEILWNQKLTCSIGIGPNKLVAKMASEYGKPDGLTIVTEDIVRKFLEPMSVRKIIGIGEKTARVMNQMGIKTIGDLATSEASLLAAKFGIKGTRYHQFALGKYKARIEEKKRVRKSIGHERTFASDSKDQGFILKRLADLCKRIHERSTKHNLLFKTVTIKIRYSSFETYTRGETLSFFTNRLQDLQRIVLKLAQKHLQRNKRIRLVGIRVSRLKSGEGQRTLG
ncbi:MAG: DNA polymerase IV [Candidatus Bathyarchaeota archaeon]|nr:MAG: DNA polymerase IV [Candidatus Bathyarchaeota archaeon]